MIDIEFNEYQRASQETMIYPGALSGDHVTGLMYTALGLTGEAGELANKIKKVYRDNMPVDDALRTDLTKEIGDTLWYLAAMASELDVDLGKAAAYNVAKLSDRARRGVLGGSGDNR